MDKNDSQQKIEDAAKVSLDHSVEALPESITSKLAEARKRAIENAGKNNSSDNQGGVVVDLASKRTPNTSMRMVWGMAASVTMASFLWFYQANNGVNIEDTVNTQDTGLANNSAENAAAVDSAEGLLLAMELARLDTESAEIVDDLDFIYWLSLENETEA